MDHIYPIIDGIQLLEYDLCEFNNKIDEPILPNASAAL